MRLRKYLKINPLFFLNIFSAFLLMILKDKHNFYYKHPTVTQVEIILPSYLWCIFFLTVISTVFLFVLPNIKILKSVLKLSLSLSAYLLVQAVEIQGHLYNMSRAAILNFLRFSESKYFILFPVITHLVLLARNLSFTSWLPSSFPRIMLSQKPFPNLSLLPGFILSPLPCRL